MPRFRNALPQLGNRLFLTDGGIETTLIFHEGLELPDFAAFHLLRDEQGAAALRKYFRAYAELAVRFETGFILEAPTWRASEDWGNRLGYSAGALRGANQAAVELLEGIRGEVQSGPVVLSGCVGPRGDGYVPSNAMNVNEAEAYHQAQVDAFAGTEADMVCAVTMNYAEEAVGIAQAARNAEMPVAILFTVETDGRLPTGQALGAAIEEVDERTAGYVSYFMINCAHPSHFAASLTGERWVSRIRGLRANASRKSHAELNESLELDTGNPVELGAEYARLRQGELPALNVMGGCCGTDVRHVERMAAANFREGFRLS